MPESDDLLREELDEAIAKVRRELEIIQSPSSIGGGADNRGVIAELAAELEALEQARTEMNRKGG